MNQKQPEKAENENTESKICQDWQKSKGKNSSKQKKT